MPTPDVVPVLGHRARSPKARKEHLLMLEFAAVMLLAVTLIAMEAWDNRHGTDRWRDE